MRRLLPYRRYDGSVEIGGVRRARGHDGLVRAKGERTRCRQRTRREGGKRSARSFRLLPSYSWSSILQKPDGTHLDSPESI